MATIRSYTNIKQSKISVGILPIESADWCYLSKDGRGIEFFEEPTIIDGTLEDNDIPCWSLAALLAVLPSVIKRNDKRMFLTLEKAGAYNLYYKSPDRLDELWETDFEPIDACYKMIMDLHKQNLI